MFAVPELSAHPTKTTAVTVKSVIAEAHDDDIVPPWRSICISFGWLLWHPPSN